MGQTDDHIPQGTQIHPRTTTIAPARIGSATPVTGARTPTIRLITRSPANTRPLTPHLHHLNSRTIKHSTSPRHETLNQRTPGQTQHPRIPTSIRHEPRRTRTPQRHLHQTRLTIPPSHHTRRNHILKTTPHRTNTHTHHIHPSPHRTSQRRTSNSQLIGIHRPSRNTAISVCSPAELRAHISALLPLPSLLKSPTETAELAELPESPESTEPSSASSGVAIWGLFFAPANPLPRQGLSGSRAPANGPGTNFPSSVTEPSLSSTCCSGVRASHKRPSGSAFTKSGFESAFLRRVSRSP